MATITSRVCDISPDHGEAETTVYGVDGEFYTADLCAADREKLVKATDPFVKVGTPVSLRDLTKNGGQGYDPQVVRAWAARNGKQVADKGRVGADVVQAWREATSN